MNSTVVMYSLQIDDIQVPLVEGSLDDTAEESEPSSMSTTQQHLRDSR